MVKSHVVVVLLAALVGIEAVHIIAGQLQGEQEPEAYWDKDSQKWVIRLTCGSFTFQGSPPLNVTWTTPNGEARFSSGYKDGRFYLHLDAPIQGGNYTCAIPANQLPDLSGNGGGQGGGGGNEGNVSVNINVDELKARLTLAEANQQTLQEMLEELEQKLNRDIQNVSMFCYGLKAVVEEHQDAIENIQQELERKEGEIDLSGPCGQDMHDILDDPWRSTSNRLENEGDRKCDRDLAHGWYRFQINGVNAAIPTKCVPERRCQTHAPVWLDLQGENLPEVGQEVDGRACANWSSDCCNWESPITVRNCGPYYVYKLQPRRTCSLAYCADVQE